MGEKMLLAIDMGNTNIVVAVFNQEELIYTWRIYTDTRRTGDEYASIIASFFNSSSFSLYKVGYKYLINCITVSSLDIFKSSFL